MENLLRKNVQRGISFIGLLFWAVIVAVLAVVAIRTVPTVTEYMSVKKAAKSAASSATTVPEVVEAFDRQAAVSYITSITGKDLQVTKNGDNIVVNFSYEKEVPLFEPVYLLIKYSGSSGSTDY
ncbi:MAG: DUF4845 domain-containing protein [Burkholderiaceae bacterium]|jgi:Tfp pilus assembly protein PilE|nr:DUF4845 domain-containing protein [Burkholderiaceae bacterium]